jgi:SPP1 family predicted phage head-tail adaptor
LNAGKLRQVITIQSLESTDDDLGGEDTRAIYASNVRASITALQGRQLYKAQQIVGEVTHEILIRYIAGVVPNMTVLFVDPGTGLNRLFEIQAVLNPDERMKEQHLLCIERNAGNVGV